MMSASALRQPIRHRPSPSVATERQTLLKLVLGMAIEQYGYEPGAACNKAAPDIREDLAGVGRDVADDTIRAKLKDAVDRVPPGDWQS